MPLSRRNLLTAGLLAPLAAFPEDRQSDPRARIKKVEVIPARVPYRSTFVIGRGLVAAGGQAGRYIYVKIQSESGLTGWGETIALPSWSYETAESIVSTIERYLAPIVIGRTAFDQAYFQKQFDEVLTPAISQGFPFAKSAVQIATLDLAGQATGLPLHRLLGGKLRDRIELCFALSIDKPEVMAEAARSFASVKCFKLKVSGEPALDAERAHAVTRARPDADIWLDANQSYRPIHLESFLRQIDGVSQVRCLEQPVKSTRPEPASHRDRRGVLHRERRGAGGPNGGV